MVVIIASFASIASRFGTDSKLKAVTVWLESHLCVLTARAHDPVACWLKLLRSAFYSHSLEIPNMRQCRGAARWSLRHGEHRRSRFVSQLFARLECPTTRVTQEISETPNSALFAKQQKLRMGWVMVDFKIAFSGVWHSSRDSPL